MHFRATSEGTSEKEALDFLKAIRETWAATSLTVNRLAVLLVLSITIFELMSSAKAKQINLAGFTFEDISFMHKVFPILIAYVFFDLIVTTNRFRFLRSTHQYAIRHLQPNLCSNDLETALAPTGPTFFRLSTPLSDANMQASDIWQKRFDAAFAVGIVTIPIAYSIRAFAILFNFYGFQSPVVWGSLLMTVLLLFAAYLLFILSVKEARD